MSMADAVWYPLCYVFVAFCLGLAFSVPNRFINPNGFEQYELGMTTLERSLKSTTHPHKSFVYFVHFSLLLILKRRLGNTLKIMKFFIGCVSCEGEGVVIGLIL